MPPASPVPGWSSGEVWTLTMATRRGSAGAHLRQASSDSPPRPHLARQPVRQRRRDPARFPRGRTRTPVVPTGAGAGAGRMAGMSTRHRSRDRGEQRHRRGHRPPARQRGLRRRRRGPPARPAGRARGRASATRAPVTPRRHVRPTRSPRSPPRSASASVLVNNAGGAFGLDPVATADRSRTGVRCTTSTCSARSA